MEKDHISPREVKELDLGVIRVKELFNAPDVEAISLAKVKLDGTNQKTINHKSDMFYYVVEGEGVFTIDSQEIAVKPGNCVSIPKGTPYFDSGVMTLLVFSTPRFDRGQVEVIE